MNQKVALIIIFNHKYDKNIPVLESIYKSRFSNIFYIIPFYTGGREDVIAVYENSYYFQGYIAQGFKYFYDKDFEHYFFIGDDLILNPVINENNYKEHLSLNNTSSFLPDFIILHERQFTWWRVKDAFEYHPKQPGLEILKELPEEKLALEIIQKLIQKKLEPLNFDEVYLMPSFSYNWKEFKEYFKWWYKRLKHKVKRTKYNLQYPLIGSYCDIFVISSDVIKQFSHYCGVFASTQLHVELAIPTALALSTSEIITEKKLQLQGKALWSSQDLQELNKYNHSLAKLLHEFPPLYLYLHPVKLSKWS